MLSVHTSTTVPCKAVFLLEKAPFPKVSPPKDVAEGFSPLTNSRRSSVGRADGIGCSGHAPRTNRKARHSHQPPPLVVEIPESILPFFVVNLLAHSTHCVLQQHERRSSVWDSGPSSGQKECCDGNHASHDVMRFRALSPNVSCLRKLPPRLTSQ